jgi:colicin import membrane protein
VAAKKKHAEATAAAQAAADRAATLKRMQGLAGASGSDSATGTALKSSGPSGSYGGKVAAAVRPNVVFPEAELVSGNPGAEFDVRLAPDGTIVGTPQLVKTSGLPNWDDAALRALQKTEKLPRDVDGTVPQRLIVTLRPKR